MRYLVLVVVFLILGRSSFAAVRTTTLEYKQADTVCQGYLAWDDAVAGKRPGVLVVPEWWGLNDYAKSRARELASLGYVALAVDMYGQGRVAADARQAGELAAAMRNDRRLMRNRIEAALAAIRRQPQVDGARIAAIGYCFGGGVVLELARDGADVRGVVSFHGNLDTPSPEATRNVKAKILVCHGADDPHVPMSQVEGFIDEMKRAGANYEINIYSGAVHAFTNPAAGNNPASGAAYNEQAATRAREAMKLFFNEVFRN